MGHFNSPFTEQCCPCRYSAVSSSSIPSFHFYQEQEGLKGEEGWGLGCVWYTAVVWKKARPLPDHYQSWGTTVIKTWMSLRGCRPQSIFHRSLGPSLLIDRSPGAAAPFCKAHCIITQQNHFIFSTYVEMHEQPVQVPAILWRFPGRQRKGLHLK